MSIYCPVLEEILTDVEELLESEANFEYTNKDVVANDIQETPKEIHLEDEVLLTEPDDSYDYLEIDNLKKNKKRKPQT